MAKFPVDTAKRQVIKALERLGFRLVREAEHIAMARENPDGTRTPLTMPNHRRIKGATLRTSADNPESSVTSSWKLITNRNYSPVIGMDVILDFRQERLVRSLPDGRMFAKFL
jgi:predicted RNA binding protein YcfA (HicA-like mRNA interferase family)